MKHELKEVDYKLMQISSSAFTEDGFIPAKYTCDGENVNPPLAIQHIPENAACLALVADDPDAPGGTWVHWVSWNIPVTHHIKEKEVHGMQGTNDFNRHGYGGPCPPGGTHHYHFKVYALDCKLDLPVTSTRLDLEKAMSGHVIAFGELVGLYRRK